MNLAMFKTYIFIKTKTVQVCIYKNTLKQYFYFKITSAVKLNENLDKMLDVSK